MHWDPEFWYALTPRIRAALGMGGVMLMLVFGWWWGIHPVAAEIRLLEDKRNVQHQTRQARWKTLLPLVPPRPLETGRYGKSKAFSPLAFQSTGRELVRWQGLNNGGELILASQWDQVPSTFAQLAEHNMQVAAFTLVMKESSLHFSLQLERDEDG
jgi:pilus assembly protein HofO